MKDNRLQMLYIHGFGSSAQTSTVQRLQQCLPGVQVHAIDVDHHPQQSIAAIEHYVADNDIDILTGTSMGGLYTLCADVDIIKVTINPATNVKDLDKVELLGRHEYFNPRADGVQQFEFTRDDMQAFTQLTLHVTPRTYIIASDHDELLGDKHDEYRRLVGERFTSTAQIGHRTNEQFTAPVTGDLWQLLNSLTKSQDGATR